MHKRWRGCLEAKAIGAHRVRENEHQAAGAIAQILFGLRIRRCRIGMIDALHDGPWRAGRAPGDGRCRPRVRIEWLNCQSIVGPALEPLERCALEHGVNEFPPIRLGGGGEIAGYCRSVGVRHAWKMPCAGAAANRRMAP